MCGNIMLGGGDKVSKLKKYRERKGMTMREVSQILNITENYLYMLESGVRTPSLALSKKIADFYETTIDELFFNNKPNRTFGEKETA